MFCDEALDAVEAIAAGDVTPDGRVAEHLTTCQNCAAALVRPESDAKVGLVSTSLNSVAAVHHADAAHSCALGSGVSESPT
jgi:hypothetical protein